MLEYIQALDGAVLLWIQEVLRLPVLDGFMTLFTQLGNAGLVWVGISLALLLVPRTRRMGFWALVALLLGLLCTNVVLKHLVGRPWLVVEGLTHLVVENDPLSFPRDTPAPPSRRGRCGRGLWSGAGSRPCASFKLC